MEDLHGANRVPPAPSRVPKSAKDAHVPSPEGPVSSTLRLLRQALGPDAQVLDRIPVAAVTMMHSKELPHCLPYKIFIGTIKVGRAKQNAWAFLSAEMRTQDGVPRMLIFSGDQGRPLAKCKSDQLEKGKDGA
ncbi:hypothetical protein E8E12_004861 [Didymella heteroderae]|uniref:Uncharacterized protein n=1 Tax=Didymella heteroderae TaxID=1769908 RepID=A0A9P4WJX3_9PLEO|nr:hypothetical protein E8E12_004861 [Didymella heteroderae]